MHTLIKPDTITKLAQLGNATQFEPSGDQPMMERRHAPYQSHSLAECITNVSTPTGKKPILKAMLTTACERNCFYCPFRAGRSKTKRMTFSADEMAGAFDTLQRTDRVQGIFLSSGIIKGSCLLPPNVSYAILVPTRTDVRHRSAHARRSKFSAYKL